MLISFDPRCASQSVYAQVCVEYCAWAAHLDLEILDVADDGGAGWVDCDGASGEVSHGKVLLVDLVRLRRALAMRDHVVGYELERSRVLVGFLFSGELMILDQQWETAGFIYV